MDIMIKQAGVCRLIIDRLNDESNKRRTKKKKLIKVRETADKRRM